MREGIAVDSAAYQDFEAPGSDGHWNSLLKNWNDPELAAGVFGVVVVHGGNGVANKRWIVVKPLLHHGIGLRLGQAKRVLDGVAAGGDGVLQPIAAINVTACLMAKTMRLVNQRL